MQPEEAQLIKVYQARLRQEFETLLKGPGITWNLNGMMNAFDRAISNAILVMLQKDYRD